MNHLYEYYFENFDIKEKAKFKEIFINNKINILMKELINSYISLNDYFYNGSEGNIGYSYIRTLNFSLIIEYTFKYFDFCLLNFLRQEDKFNSFEYWNNSVNKIFEFYCNYKLLTMDKN